MANKRTKLIIGIVIGTIIVFVGTIFGLAKTGKINLKMLADILYNSQGSGLKGEYFQRDKNDVSPVLKLTRTDSVIDFHWNDNSPDPILNPEHFSVRWSGQIQIPTTGEYTFYTISDDGTVLYINNKPAINNWKIQPATETASQKIKLEANTKYNIVLDYFESYNIADISLMWSGPGIPKQVIPQAYLYPTINQPQPSTKANVVYKISTDCSDCPGRNKNNGLVNGIPIYYGDSAEQISNALDDNINASSGYFSNVPTGSQIFTINSSLSPNFNPNYQTLTVSRDVQANSSGTFETSFVLKKASSALETQTTVDIQGAIIDKEGKALDNTEVELSCNAEDAKNSNCSSIYPDRTVKFLYSSKNLSISHGHKQNFLISAYNIAQNNTSFNSYVLFIELHGYFYDENNDGKYESDESGLEKIIKSEDIKIDSDGKPYYHFELEHSILPISTLNFFVRDNFDQPIKNILLEVTGKNYAFGALTDNNGNVIVPAISLYESYEIKINDQVNPYYDKNYSSFLEPKFIPYDQSPGQVKLYTLNNLVKTDNLIISGAVAENQGFKAQLIGNIDLELYDYRISKSEPIEKIKSLSTASQPTVAIKVGKFMLDANASFDQHRVAANDHEFYVKCILPSGYKLQNNGDILQKIDYRTENIVDGAIQATFNFYLEKTSGTSTISVEYFDATDGKKIDLRTEKIAKARLDCLSWYNNINKCQESFSVDEKLSNIVKYKLNSADISLSSSFVHKFETGNYIFSGTYLAIQPELKIYLVRKNSEGVYCQPIYGNIILPNGLKNSFNFCTYPVLKAEVFSTENIEKMKKIVDYLTHLSTRTVNFYPDIFIGSVDENRACAHSSDNPEIGMDSRSFIYLSIDDIKNTDFKTAGHEYAHIIDFTDNLHRKYNSVFMSAIRTIKNEKCNYNGNLDIFSSYATLNTYELWAQFFSTWTTQRNELDLIVRNLASDNKCRGVIEVLSTVLEQEYKDMKSFGQTNIASKQISSIKSSDSFASFMTNLGYSEYPRLGIETIANLSNSNFTANQLENGAWKKTVYQKLSKSEKLNLQLQIAKNRVTTLIMSGRTNIVDQVIKINNKVDLLLRKLGFEISSASISGKVEDFDGPISGIKVTYGNKTTITDRNGNYKLTRVPTGNFEFSASDPSINQVYRSFSLNISKNQQLQNINILIDRPSFVLSGKIFKGSDPLKSGKIIVDGNLSFVINNNGEFHISLKQGRHVFLIKNNNGKKMTVTNSGKLNNWPNIDFDRSTNSIIWVK